jgi:hypothetical protein
LECRACFTSASNSSTDGGCLLIHAPQLFQKLWRPAGTLADRSLKRSNYQTIPAEAQRLCAAIDRLQQGCGNVYGGRHEYIDEYTVPRRTLELSSRCELV